MYQQYINGKLVDGLGKPLDVLDPSTMIRSSIRLSLTGLQVD